MILHEHLLFGFDICFLLIFYYFSPFVCHLIYFNRQDVKQEKQHEELIQGVEAFDKNQGLKHTTTSEKVVLPSAEGVYNYKLCFPFYP